MYINMKNFLTLAQVMVSSGPAGAQASGKSCFLLNGYTKRIQYFHKTFNKYLEKCKLYFVYPNLYIYADAGLKHIDAGGNTSQIFTLY